MDIPEPLITPFRNCKQLIPEHFDHINLLIIICDFLNCLHNSVLQSARNCLVKHLGISILVDNLDIYQQEGWLERFNNWADYNKEIKDVHNHWIHIKEFQEGNLKFFRETANDYSYWSGCQGIVGVYLILYNIFKDQTFLQKAINGLNTLVSNINYQHDNKQLYMLLSDAFKLTKNKKFELICDNILSSLYENNFNVSYNICLITSKLNVLSTSMRELIRLEKSELLTKKLSLIFQKNINTKLLYMGLIFKIFPKTLWVWSKSTDNVLGNFPISFDGTENSRTIIEKCIKIFKAEIKLSPKRHLFNEALQIDSRSQKLHKRFSNPALIRAEELSLLISKDALLCLDDETFLEQKLILNLRLDANTSNYNWNDSITKDSIPTSKAETAYMLLLLSSTGITDNMITTPEFLVLQQFLEVNSVNDAINDYLNETDIAGDDFTFAFSRIVYIIRKFVFETYLIPA